MEDISNKDIVKEIESVERILKGLKLSLAAREPKATAKSQKKESNELQDRAKETQVRVEELQVGDKAKILNPNFGQESVGTVTRIGHGTDRITIEGRLFKRKIVRARKNLVRINKFSK